MVGVRRLQVVWAMILLFVLACLAYGSARAVFEYKFPYMLPYYVPEETGLSESMLSVARVYPEAFYRPIDDLGPRPGGYALAIGSSYVAKAKGALALAWNPAGMATAKRNEIAFDGVLTQSGSQADWLPSAVTVADLPEFRTGGYKFTGDRRPAAGFMGISMPVARVGAAKVAVGGAFRRYLETSYANDIVLTLNVAEGSGVPFIVGKDTDERGAVESYTFGAAVSMNAGRLGNLSLGATGNVLKGRWRSHVRSRANLVSFLEGRSYYWANSRGFAAELGAQLEVLERLAFGAWYRFPFTLKVKDAHFGLTWPGPVITRDMGEMGFPVRFEGQVADYDLEIPGAYGVGVVVGPFYGLEVSASVDYRPWSEVKIKNHGVAETETGLVDYSIFDSNLPFEDVVSYGGGISLPVPLLGPKLRGAGLMSRLMFGYRTLPLSMRGADPVEGERPYYLGDQIDGDATSFGLSLESKVGVTVEVGVEMRSWKFRRWLMDDPSYFFVEAEKSGVDAPDPWWLPYAESFGLAPDEAAVFNLHSPWEAAPLVKCSDTVLRLSARMSF